MTADTLADGARKPAPFSHDMNTQDGARAILQHIEAVYVPVHDYVSVRESDYQHLDIAFYRSSRLYLEAQAFLHLEDCEDRTLAAAPGNVFKPMMIRVMVSLDGTIMAGIYDPRVKPLWIRILLFVLGKLPGGTIDLETEFVDGSFICTSNAMTASALSKPALIDCEYLPSKTPIPRILARHRERVSQKREKAEIEPHRFLTIDAVRASQGRMIGIKAAFRKEIGGVTKEELARVFSGSPGLADEVHREITKLQDKDND